MAMCNTYYLDMGIYWSRICDNTCSHSF